MAQTNGGTLSADIMDEDFTEGREGAKDIPNAQVGEGIQGTHGHGGSQEQMGDVGNRPDTAYDANRRDETEKVIDGDEDQGGEDV